MSLFIVTSASGPNGDGYGAVLAFTPGGELVGRFSNDDRISDPRGLVLDPVIAPNGNLLVNSEWPFGALRAQ
jgi:hypothetical protein